jgi:hypothetical protein
MGFRAPIMSPLSRSGRAAHAAPSAGMHPKLNVMPRTGKAANSLGKKYPAPSLKSNAHDAHPVMKIAGQAQQKRGGAKKTFPLNMKAKTPVQKQHRPSTNPNNVFNNNSGKWDISKNPSKPGAIVPANSKGSAFYGQ